MKRTAPSRILGLMRRVLRDEKAAMAPAIAGLAIVFVASAGMALDVGLYHLDNRELRAATEAAALAAAMDPAQAQARAQTYLSRNGYDPGILKSVQVGRYCADIALTPEQRFDTTYSRCPGNGLANAVRIEAGRPSRRYLSAVLGGATVIPDLAATATAARIDEAGVGITSGILTVNNGLVDTVNGLLGALLDIQLTLNTSQIEALMHGDVDAGLFFDALAGDDFDGTYGELVQQTYGLRDIAQAAASATTDPSVKAALSAFALQVTNSYKVPLKDLFGLGVWKNMPVGEADARPSLRAGLNAYQLVAFAVQAGPGAIDASDLVGLAVPGSTVRLAAMGRGPIDRPRFAFGPAGETQVGTSALRLQLQLGLGGLGGLSLLGIPLPLSVDSVPLFIDVAAATADITAIDCSNTAEQARDTRVTVNARSGLVNAYIGEVPANALTRSMPLSMDEIEPATLVNVLNLVTIKAKAIALPLQGNQGNLIFGPGGNGTLGSPTNPGTSASIGNGSQVGTLIGTLTDSLLGPDGLKIEVGPLCLPLVCNAGPLRSQILPAIVTPLTGLVGNTVDPVLDNVLAALGVQLGHATIWATGARCGVPVLV